MTKDELIQDLKTAKYLLVSNDVTHTLFSHRHALKIIEELIEKLKVEDIEQSPRAK